MAPRGFERSYTPAMLLTHLPGHAFEGKRGLGTGVRVCRFNGSTLGDQGLS